MSIVGGQDIHRHQVTFDVSHPTGNAARRPAAPEFDKGTRARTLIGATPGR
jgi:hypothetical protein